MSSYLLRADEDYCFSPRECYRRRAEESRVTPLSHGNARGRKRDAHESQDNQRHPRTYFSPATVKRSPGRAACLEREELRLFRLDRVIEAALIPAHDAMVKSQESVES